LTDIQVNAILMRFGSVYAKVIAFNRDYSRMYIGTVSDACGNLYVNDYGESHTAQTGFTDHLTPRIAVYPVVESGAWIQYPRWRIIL
jgi:hypothetical protein